ncbi:hypothetical protein ACX0MV_10165 [Pseudomonas borbori]
MQPVGWFAILWRAGAVLALLLGLLLLAVSARSQSPEGVAGLFGFSLFVSVGFLLFGRSVSGRLPKARRAKTSVWHKHMNLL